MAFRVCCGFVIASILTINCNTYAIPLSDILNEQKVSDPSNEFGSIEDPTTENATTNGTKKDLYVIKAVVYEIGILTEADENSTSAEETHERVDLTFFDAKSNGSHFDLGQIPLPVQTNITGQVLTGIAPIKLGSIQNASDILSTLPLTGTIINITHSDTSFINLTHKPSFGENGTILNAEDIAKIPGVNGTNALFIDAMDQGNADEEE